MWMREQTYYKQAYHDKKCNDCHPVLETAGCSPLEASPIMRGKLLNRPFSLSFDAFDISEMTCP
jgi:hypothetical protein